MSILDKTDQFNEKIVISIKNGLEEGMINDKVSAGTFGVLKGLSRPYNLSKSWNLFIINIFTLTRNILSYFDLKYETNVLKTDNKTILNYLKRDIEILVSYIKTYGENIKTMSPKTTYTIVFYLPNYFSFIDKSLLRPPNKISRITINFYEKIYSSFSNMLGKKHQDIYQIDLEEFPCNFVMLDPSIYSTISLFRLINNHFGINEKILMISHILVDYHLKRFFPMTSIMESHTGRVLFTKENLNEKLSGVENIPFNKYTHWLFGDKYLLKSHIPRGKKNEILLRSKKEKWTLFSENKLKKEFKKYGVILDESINKFNPY